MRASSEKFSGETAGLREAGGILLVATGIALLAIMHHPVASGMNAAAVVQDIAAKQGIDRLVHGGLIGVMVLFLVGLTRFSVALGLHLTGVAAALICYASGVAATVGAAVLDGFVTPAIAAHYLPAGLAGAGVAMPLLVLCGLVIQSLSTVGLVLMAAGVLAWGVVLCAAAGRQVYAGWFGVAAGGSALVLTLAYQGRLGPGVLLPILAILGSWNVAAALWMLAASRAGLTARPAQ